MQQFKETQKIDLATYVDLELNQLTTAKPFFPEYVSRKLCEEVGLESSDDLFYRLVSVSVDFELKRLIQDINHTKIKRKKDDEERMLKTSDVHKLFQNMHLPLEKPHFYPSLGIEDRD